MRRGRHVAEHHAGAGAEHHRRSHQRPIERILVANFVRGILGATGGRHVYFGDDLVGQQDSFARIWRGRRDEELRGVHFAGAGGRGDLHLGAQGDQRRAQAGGRDELGRSGREDGVILVLAIGDEALAVFSAEEAEAVAEVPAARALRQVAADGSHVADLRRRDAAGGGGERRILGADGRVFQHIFNGGGGADAQSAGCLRDALEFLKVLDIDQALGLHQVFLHHAEQVSSTGQHGGVAVRIA